MTQSNVTLSWLESADWIGIALPDPANVTNSEAPLIAKREVSKVWYIASLSVVYKMTHFLGFTNLRLDGSSSIRNIVLYTVFYSMVILYGDELLWFGDELAAINGGILGSADLNLVVWDQLVLWVNGPLLWVSILLTLMVQSTTKLISIVYGQSLSCHSIVFQVADQIACPLVTVKKSVRIKQYFQGKYWPDKRTSLSFACWTKQPHTFLVLHGWHQRWTT